MKTKLLIIAALIGLSGCQTTKQAQTEPAKPVARGMTDDEMYKQAAIDQAYQIERATVSQADIDAFSKEFNDKFKPVKVDEQTTLDKMIAFPDERMIAVLYKVDVGPVGELSQAGRFEFQNFIDDNNAKIFCNDELWRTVFDWGFVAFFQYEIANSKQPPMIQYLSERKCVVKGY